MNERVANLAWPLARLNEAMESLARQTHLLPRAVEIPPPAERLARSGPDMLSSWMGRAADALGIEAEQVEATYDRVEELVSRAAPALFYVPLDNGPHYVAVVAGRRNSLRVLGPDSRLHKLAPADLCEAVREALETPHLAEVEALVDRAGIRGRHRAVAAAGVLRQRLAHARLLGCWLLRPGSEAPIMRHVRQAKIPGQFGGLIGSHAAQHVLWILSWWLLGVGALSGRFDKGWLYAWALILMAVVLIRAYGLWAQGRLAIGFGAILKQRLLHGALRFDTDSARRTGSGQLLGRVIESEAVEMLALGGGLLGVMAVVEVAAAIWVLAIGPGRGLIVALYCIWLLVVLGGSVQFYRRRRRWTDARLSLTHDLVERMTGHRTRLVQELEEHIHDGEDTLLERYYELSRHMDRTAVVLRATAERGWLVLGLCGLGPAFVSAGVTPASLAVGLGGVLLGAAALRKVADGLAQLFDSAIVWRRVAPLYRAAVAPENHGSPEHTLASTSIVTEGRTDGAALEARDVTFRYRPAGEAVLKKCDLDLRSGDRVLLEGPSGGGKSTLAAVLAGQRRSESGLVLLDGLDRNTIGERNWRRRVALAPQFQDNHILTGTLGFNLLMGGDWPAEESRLLEAQEICRELGLGPTIERMPSGLRQAVGETGWQLSHGEKSRVYLARALLQRAEVVVLDESFAALDPHTLRTCLDCVHRRARALLVIAHP